MPNSPFDPIHDLDGCAEALGGMLMGINPIVGRRAARFPQIVAQHLRSGGGAETGKVRVNSSDILDYLNTKFPDLNSPAEYDNAADMKIDVDVENDGGNYELRLFLDSTDATAQLANFNAGTIMALVSDSDDALKLRQIANSDGAIDIDTATDATKIYVDLSADLGDLDNADEAGKANHDGFGWNGATWKPYSLLTTAGTISITKADGSWDFALSADLGDLDNVTEAGKNTHDGLGWNGATWKPYELVSSDGSITVTKTDGSWDFELLAGSSGDVIYHSGGSWTATSMSSFAGDHLSWSGAFDVDITATDGIEFDAVSTSQLQQTDPDTETQAYTRTFVTDLEYDSDVSHSCLNYKVGTQSFDAWGRDRADSYSADSGSGWQDVAIAT